MATPSGQKASKEQKQPSRLLPIALFALVVPILISVVLAGLGPQHRLLHAWKDTALRSLVAHVPALTNLQWLSTISPSSPSTTSESSAVAESEVRRVRWSKDDKTYAAYLRTLSEPIVLTDTYESSVVPRFTVDDVASELISHQKREGLSGRNHHVTGVFKHSSSPIFGPYYDPDRPMHRLSRVRDRAQGPYRYETNASLAAGDVSRVFTSSGPPYFALSIDPQLLRLGHRMDLRAMLAVRPDKSSVNVWLGMHGGTTPCHFDGYHNTCVAIINADIRNNTFLNT